MITINGNIYSLKKLELTDCCLMEKNGEAIWLMPDDVFEDFVQIFAYTGTIQKFIRENPLPNDDAAKVNILSGTTTT